MSGFLSYTLNRISQALASASLENERLRSPDKESEENMPINRKKIRREVMVNGAKAWITADTEQEYANKLLRLAGVAHPVTGEKHRFRDYAEKWFEIFCKPNVSHVTALTYRRQLDNHIYPVLEGRFIEDITPFDVQQVFNQMRNDTTQETKNKVKIVLNQIFKMAIDDSLTARNPLQSPSVKIKGTAPKATKPYSVAQMRFLARHLDDIAHPMDRIWLALSISLPLRAEEVLGLRWADIDLENHMIQVRNTVTHPTRNEPEFKPYTKTASSVRDLIFPPEILRYLRDGGDPDAFVIGGKHPVSYTQLRAIRRRVRAETGFDDAITPRRFRTTVATDISAMTHDLKLVQQMLGHATPQMTLKHYDKGRSNAVDASDAIGKCYGLQEN